jgi:hypothetical protein
MKCKYFYKTKKDAETALNFYKKNPKEKHRPQRVYKCEKCKGWHLTKFKRKPWHVL